MLLAASSVSMIVLTVSVLNPSLRVLVSSWSSAAVGVGVEKFDDINLVGSAEDWRLELSEQVSSSDSSWKMGTLAFTLVKKAIFSLEENK